MSKHGRGWCACVVMCVQSVAAVGNPDGWWQIDVSAPFVDGLGNTRTPGCSRGPVPNEDTGRLEPGDPDFSFFVRAGDPDKLLVVWDGGGACWDANTCVGSALIGRPLYQAEVDETPSSLNDTGGLLDRGNPDNPVGDYTQVLIPYCTADVHLGASEQAYALEGREGQASWTLHHRGYDNTLAVLAWLADRYDARGAPPSEVVLTGASAGGYGAQFGAPAYHRWLPPSTRIRVLVDSANGIVSEAFYQQALGSGGVWNVWANVAPELADALGSGARELPVALNEALALQYPDTRFGQYTRAFDDVQIFFFNVSEHVDSLRRWIDPVRLFAAGLEWSVRAQETMARSAATAQNYRYYLADGTEHTILASDELYDERTDGVPLLAWLRAMLQPAAHGDPGGDWQTVSCAPGCEP